MPKTARTGSSHCVDIPTTKLARTAFAEAESATDYDALVRRMKAAMREDMERYAETYRILAEEQLSQ